MSTSDNSLKKPVLSYLFATIFTLVFASVYEYFSHGVLSGYMLSAFVYPLVIGAGLLLLVKLARLPKPDGMVLGLHAWSVAGFTVGNIMKGVFEIYGSVSSYTGWYFIAGSVLLIAAAVVYMCHIIKSEEI